MKRKKKTSKGSSLFRAISAFEKWYYRLSYRTRHVVGFLLVFLTIGLLCGIVQGGYLLVSGCYHWVTQWTTSDSDRGVEYSVGGSHYDFPLLDSEKHPERRPRYSTDFSSVNDVHLEAARQLGIEPQETRADLERMHGQLVHLTDTRYYSILPLDSSSPYLVPRAADFLTALGRLLQEYSGTSSRFLISSVLRTQEDVRHLSRVNVNASKNSTHCYGTTIDITYARFDARDGADEAQLKEYLAKALYDLQAKGYCYVKYERREPCFHITVR